MAYLNGKKIMFSPHYHSGIDSGELITVKISIDSDSRGEYITFDVYGTRVDNDGAITAYHSGNIGNELQVDLLKNTNLVIKHSSGLTVDFDELPIIYSGNDFRVYSVDDRLAPTQDVFEIQFIAE